MSRILSVMMLLLVSVAPVHAQDFNGLLDAALRFGVADGAEPLPPGPIWVDTVQINGFLRAMGAEPLADLTVLRAVYPRRVLSAVSSYEEVLDQGAANDPRLLRLIAEEEQRGGRLIKRPSGDQARRRVVWIRDFGLYAAIRVVSVVDKSTIRFEVMHKRSGGFFMPLGDRPILEAHWNGTAWDLRLIAKKITLRQHDNHDATRPVETVVNKLPASIHTVGAARIPG